MKPRKKSFQRFSHDLWRTGKSTYSPSFLSGQGVRKGRKKLSDFGKRLQARALLKILYGQIRTKYFRKLAHEASKMRLRRATALLTLLESRLDVLLFRCGFAVSIDAARQLISHKKVFVNGQLMTRPKYILQPGDIFSYPGLHSLSSPSLSLSSPSKEDTPQEEESLASFGPKAPFESFRPGKLYKPLQVEVSYALGRGIFLFRPQSLHFPRRPFPDLAMESFSQ